MSNKEKDTNDSDEFDFDEYLDEDFADYIGELEARDFGPGRWRRVDMLIEQRRLMQQLADFDEYTLD